MQARTLDGQKTKIIYNYIKDERYQDAIRLLNAEIQVAPQSRAMSLLAYCYYMSQDYAKACSIYEQLTYLYPTEEEYKVNYSQCLYKMCEWDTALRSISSIANPEYQEQLTLLKAYISYETEDFNTAKNLSDSMTNEANAAMLKAAILLKEGKFEEALEKFEHLNGVINNQPELVYNIALCHYKMKQFDMCLKYISDLIDRAIKFHPELFVREKGSKDFISVGNTSVLKQSALVEAFNLKAAIEYSLKNWSKVKEALAEIPPRHESELDPVTLMNFALMNIDTDPTGGFKKLDFLLNNPPFPPETFSNLLLLYCKFHYYNLAADILAKNTELTLKYIKDDDFEYLEAFIFQNVNPEETAKKMDTLGARHIESLQRITRQIKECRANDDNKGMKKALKEYDDCLEKYIPVMMAEANIYWNKEDYAAVERLFRTTNDLCSVHDTWRLNYAHTFFVQDDEEKYPEAIYWYEKVLEKNADDLLELPAIVIANLCVSYIMISENEKAEAIIRNLEELEKIEAEKSPEKPLYHLCIVNLVIGTLYCSRNNYPFGVGRIIKSFEPISKKLGPDTWYYAKRCFLSMIEKLAKHMIVVPDRHMIDLLDFLESCEKYGKKIRADINHIVNQGEPMVSDEARLMRRFLIKFRDQ